MSQQDLSRSLILDEHTIHLDTPIHDGCEYVFHAVDSEQQEVAAKKIVANNAAKLQSAFDATATLDSPHLLQPAKLLKESNTAFYLTMEVATYNLHNMLYRQRQIGELLSPKFVHDILGQILDGLKALHDAGIVNGNLKPSNILLFT